MMNHSETGSKSISTVGSWRSNVTGVDTFRWPNSRITCGDMRQHLSGHLRRQPGESLPPCKMPVAMINRKLEGIARTFLCAVRRPASRRGRVQH